MFDVTSLQQRFAARGEGRFAATADFERLAEPDAVLIRVPTPLGRHREPDLSFVETPTREVVKPILDGTGLCCGEKCFLAYSPEREDPGDPSFETARIPKVVGGADVAYHDPLVPVIPPTREHAALAGHCAVDLTANTLAGFDAAVIVTDHDAIDWAMLQRHSRLVVDTRNRLGGE